MANSPWDVGKITADVKAAGEQAEKMRKLQIAELIKEKASDILGPAADDFARNSRTALAASAPFDFSVLDPGGAGQWRGGVRARLTAKKANLSLLAMAPHDLNKWSRGRMSHPFMGNRAKWYDRAVPEWKGTSTRVGKTIRGNVLSDLGTSIAELLEQRLT